jgi:hypothetical protein
MRGRGDDRIQVQTGLTGWLSLGRLGTLHSFGCTWPATCAPTAGKYAADYSSRE